VVVLGTVGVFGWRAMVKAEMAPPIGKNVSPAVLKALKHLPTTFSYITNQPVADLVNDRLGTTVGELAIGLVLGLLAGYGVAGLRIPLGRVGGGIGRVVGILWTAPLPIMFMMLVLAATSSRSGLGWLLDLTIAAVTAILVASAVAERWARGAWTAGWTAGVSALGHALAMATGIVVIGETLLNRPGLGALLIRSYMSSDNNVVLAVVTALLAFALAGAAVAALFGALADFLDRSDRAPAQTRPNVVLLILALATLAIPVLVVLGSLVVKNPVTFDVRHAQAGSSMSHPFGTDLEGRDVFARVLVGYRTTLLYALGALALATLPGVIWGALAALVADRVPRFGGPVAEAILSPGRLVMVAPLLIGGFALAGPEHWPVVPALALVLTPRIAVAVAEVGRPIPRSLLVMVQLVGGILLRTLGVAAVLLLGLELIGVALLPPHPSIGGELSNSLSLGGHYGLIALLALVAIAPLLLAGAALLRHPRQAEAAAALET